MYTGLSGLVSKMVIAGEAGFEMVRDLINQIIREEVLPAESEREEMSVIPSSASFASFGCIERRIGIMDRL